MSPLVGISNIGSIRISSMIERKPRAPVLRSIAFAATARRASSRNSRRTSSISKSGARVRTTTDDVVTGKQTLRIASATREISRRAIGAHPDTPADRSTLDSSPNLRLPVSRSPRSPPWPRTVTPPTSGVPPPTPPVRPRETPLGSSCGH